MKNKIINIPSSQLLLLLSIINIMLLFLVATLLLVGTPNAVVLLAIILVFVSVVGGFVLIRHYIVTPLEVLHQYLLGNTKKLPELIALDLNEELSDIVFELNNLQANLESKSEQSIKQSQSIVAREGNLDYFGRLINDDIDIIKRACKQVEYQSEIKNDYKKDLIKELNKLQAKLVQLINKQKNNIEFLK